MGQPRGGSWCRSILDSEAGSFYFPVQQAQNNGTSGGYTNAVNEKKG